MREKKKKIHRVANLTIKNSKLSAAKSLQSCLTLCKPIDGSPPGSPVPGMLQTRTLEWVAISFSNAWKWKVKVKSLSRVRLLATPWTAAYQAPPSMRFSRQEYSSGVPSPSPCKLSRLLPKTITVSFCNHHILPWWSQLTKGLRYIILTCQIYLTLLQKKLFLFPGIFFLQSTVHL